MRFKFLLFLVVLRLSPSDASEILPRGIRRGLLANVNSSVQDKHNRLAGTSDTGVPDLLHQWPTLVYKDGKAAATSGTSWSQLSNTFCRGPGYTNYTKTNTVQECQSACEKAVGCWMYSWCDAVAADGCQVYAYPLNMQDAYTENVEPGTCVWSGGGQLTFAQQSGDAWTCGKAYPSRGACSSATECNTLNQTLVGFKSPKTLSMLSNTLTVEACCAACQAATDCNAFLYCQRNSSSCRFKYRDGQGNIVVVNEPDDVEPGTCWLVQADLATGVVTPVVGDCPYASGTPDAITSNAMDADACV